MYEHMLCMSICMSIQLDGVWCSTPAYAIASGAAESAEEEVAQPELDVCIRICEHTYTYAPRKSSGPA